MFSFSSSSRTISSFARIARASRGIETGFFTLSSSALKGNCSARRGSLPSRAFESHSVRKMSTRAVDGLAVMNSVPYWETKIITAQSETTSLHRIPRLPLPLLLFCVPPDGRIHHLGLQDPDNKNRRLLFAHQHAPHLYRIKGHVDQHEFGFRGCSMPALFAAAEDDQQMVAVLRIGAET